MITTEIITVDGLNMRCLRAGPPDGRPLFLLHGIGVLADFWQPNIPFFAEAGFAVYAPDLPGFGQSDSPPGLGTPDKIADILASWIRTLDQGPVYIAGHSMGGTFGLAMVARHPDLVAKVVAVGPFGVGSGFKITRKTLTHLVYPSVVLSLFGWRDWAFKRIVESNFYDNDKLAPELFDLARTQGPQQKAISRFQAAAGLGVQFGADLSAQSLCAQPGRKWRTESQCHLGRGRCGLASEACPSDGSALARAGPTRLSEGRPCAYNRSSGAFSEPGAVVV